MEYYDLTTSNGQGRQAFVSDRQTLYVNPFMVVSDKGYTKHFYIEGERIASKIGEGMNISGSSVNEPNTPPELQWYRPYVGYDTNFTVRGFNLQTSTDYDNKTTEINNMLDRDLDSIGQGSYLSFPLRLSPVIMGALTEDDPETQQYFFHPDHLGSSNYVSDINGLPTERLEYFPFGEILVNEHRTSYSTPYKFSAKELDGESGLSYFGARYYDSKTSIFHGVDPLSGNYPSVSGYTYCLNNPVKYTDPFGLWVKGAGFFNNLIRSDNYNKARMVAKNHQNSTIHRVNTKNRKGWNVSWSEPDDNANVKSNFDVFCYAEFTENSPAGRGGGDYLGTANNWLNGAGYAYGGLGVVKIGMLDYRSSLPLSSKIGTFSRFSTTYRTLGATSKVLGRTATWVGVPISLGLDIGAFTNGDIGVGRFTYRQVGLGAAIGGGAAIGSAFGGPMGATGGALIGAGFVAGEFVYDGAVNVWNLTNNQISNFENALKSGWYPGR